MTSRHPSRLSTFMLLAMLVMTLLCALLIAMLGAELFRSDAAGNGLTQSFFVIAVGVAWAFGAITLWIATARAGAGSVVDSSRIMTFPWWLFVVAAAGQAAAATALLNHGTPTVLRVGLLVALQWPMLAVLLVTLQRGWGLSMPTQLSGHRFAWSVGVVALASTLSWIIGRRAT